MGYVQTFQELAEHCKPPMADFELLELFLRGLPDELESELMYQACTRLEEAVERGLQFHYTHYGKKTQVSDPSEVYYVHSQKARLHRRTARSQFHGRSRSHTRSTSRGSGSRRSYFSGRLFSSGRSFRSNIGRLGILHSNIEGEIIPSAMSFPLYSFSQAE